MGRGAPILVVLVILTVVWYGGALTMNWDQARALADDDAGWRDIATSALTMGRPLLPTPDQVAGEMFRGLFDHPPTSPRSLLFHAGVTAWAALLGFIIALLGGMSSGNRNRCTFARWIAR